ncbi:uncharacterized protein METZ01_LOCUS112781 [marine metagenome]|uniref:Uncharacterized protein n=1 Tax=marine metagenome TaxID=408172 RepID=A0A381X6V1_9ZZZZ
MSALSSLQADTANRPVGLPVGEVS